MPRFEKLQLTGELADEFRDVARNAIDKYGKEKSRGDLILCQYEDGSSQDDHEVEFMSLSEHEEISEQIESLSSMAGLGTFEADNDFVSNLRFYVIVIQSVDGDSIYFFRTYSPKMELSRSRRFAALFNHDHFDSIKEPAFLFDQYVDCISLDRWLFIFKKSLFRKIFQFFELAQQAGRETLSKIETKVPIQNFEEFGAACMRDKRKLAKLRAITSNPLIETVTMERLKAVITDYGLSIQMVEENGQEMLVYDSSDHWVLLRLLEDSFMRSPITEQRYEITSKRTHRRG